MSVCVRLARRTRAKAAAPPEPTELPAFSVFPLLVELLENRLNRHSAFFRELRSSASGEGR